MPHAPALLRLAAMLAALCGLLAGPADAASAAPLPSPGDPEAAHLWPRVFYTPQQRASIEAARRLPPGGTDQPTAALVTQAAPTFQLDGLALGRKNATAWINGQMLQHGETYAGRTVHIDQSAVRLRQSGESDIVLRPGQQVSDTGAVLGDVVAPGVVRKK
ncbi:hypothetical protein [Comamonas granuli]|uniref:hypothetical protein n=1 Tax=Comamonas granuli TaxID=290309 RepID=UPI0005A82558|nr:hypothetical protein [Comamonas granuli]